MSALPSCSASKSAEKVSDKPLNIVYIMTDDHTAQMMSAYDTRNINTPNLDRIAADGVKFTNSLWPTLSGPSRACMLTGKHSHTNGFVSNETSVFDASQPTWPRYLRDAGYETAIVGKWHLETMPQGFDYLRRLCPDKATTGIPASSSRAGDTVAEKGYITHMITDKSLHWLDSVHDPSKPFALIIHHKAIHRNRLP